MKVVIKETEYDYVSDYPVGWFFSAGDPFKFPVTIPNEDAKHKYQCFIKRFEKKNPENISGWDLLQLLRGKYEKNLARLYDIVNVQEKGKDIYYVFFEFLDGQTLDKSIAKRNEINLQNLTNSLFNAIHALNTKGFWFVDFCEKNIFADKSGSYFLVDLDSAHSIEEAPENDMYGSKDYWILVIKFYKNILQDTRVKLSDINGISFNYLQIPFLILQIKLLQKRNRKEYDSIQLFDNLPSILNEVAPKLKELFITVAKNGSQQLSGDDVLEIKNIIEQDIIPDRIIPVEKPVIIEFSTSKNEIKNEESFTLTWRIKNADRLELYKEGVFFKQLNNNQESIELKEFFYDNKKETSYSLVAYNESGETKSHPVIINLDAHKDPPPKPIINRFYADKTKIENFGSFTLRWEVANADKIELYKNNALIDLAPDQKSIELKGVFDNDKKEYAYVLIARKNDFEAKSNPVIISLAKKPNIVAIALALVAVLIIFFIIHLIINKPPAPPKIEVFLNEKTMRENTNLKIVIRNLKDTAGLRILFNKTEGQRISFVNDLLLVKVPSFKKFPPHDSVKLAILDADTLLYETRLSYVPLATSPIGFSVNDNAAYEDSYITVHTINLSDTTGLHILFNTAEGTKNAFVKGSLFVKTPHLDKSYNNRLINVSISRAGNQLFQKGLIYHESGNGNQPPTTQHLAPPINYDLIFYASSAYWGQVIPVNRELPWKGFGFQSGSAGTKNTKMEDGKSYNRVLQFYPVNYGAGTYSVAGSFLLHTLAGNKTFTAKVGFLSGSGADNVKFEVRVLTTTGQLLRTQQSSKAYDNSLSTITVEFPSSGPDFRIQLVITGSQSSIVSAGWIDPVVKVQPGTGKKKK